MWYNHKEGEPTIMFEIFIAVFGGLYYGIRILSGKAISISHQLSRTYANGSFENIEADLETVFMAGDILWDEKTKEEILHEFEPEMAYILGENWREKYKFVLNLGTSETAHNLFFHSINDSRGDPLWIAKELLLAKEGKIDFKERLHKLVGSPEMIDRQIKTFKVIEREIQKTHPSCKIKIIPPNYKYDSGWIRWECA